MSYLIQENTGQIYGPEMKRGCLSGRLSMSYRKVEMYLHIGSI